MVDPWIYGQARELEIRHALGERWRAADLCARERQRKQGQGL